MGTCHSGTPRFCYRKSLGTFHPGILRTAPLLSGSLSIRFASLATSYALGFPAQPRSSLQGDPPYLSSFAKFKNVF